MRSKLARSAVVVMMAAIMAAVPLSGGCGGGGAGGENQVIIGFLGDFTGPGAQTCVELHKGMSDYLKMIEAEDPIEGVEIKVITWDSRLDYARVKPGYVWLKGQSSDVILDFNATYTSMLWEDHAKDQLPSFCFNTMPDTVGKDYMFSFSVDYTTEGNAIAQWLVEDWESQGNDWPIKVGYVGLSGLVSNTEVGDVLEAACEGAYAGKMELKWEAAPSGTTAWATEIDRLKDSDVIITNLVGPSLSSFLGEALNRGYTGQFIGTTISMMGFWELVRSNVPLEKVDGVRAMHAQMLWTDGTPFMEEIGEILDGCRPAAEAAQLRKGTSYPSGQLFIMILVDVIRRAAETVGPENVDGAAIWESAQDINMDIDGWGEAFQCHEGTNILHRTFRTIEYRYDEDDWFQIGDWFLPESMQ